MYYLETYLHCHSRLSSRKNHFLSVLVVLAATRLVRGWNQTGQKFAGEPDVAKTFIIPHPSLLWVLVSATYFWIGQDISHGFSGLSPAAGFIIASGLTIAAFVFKLAYTKEDAPELALGVALKVLAHLPPATLVARAQAVFIGLAAATAGVLWIIVCKHGSPLKTTCKWQVDLSLQDTALKFCFSSGDSAQSLHVAGRDTVQNHQHPPLPPV